LTISNIGAASVQTLSRSASVIDRFVYSMLLGGSRGNLPFSISLTELRLWTTVFPQMAFHNAEVTRPSFGKGESVWSPRSGRLPIGSSSLHPNLLLLLLRLLAEQDGFRRAECTYLTKPIGSTYKSTLASGICFDFGRARGIWEFLSGTHK